MMTWAMISESLVMWKMEPFSSSSSRSSLALVSAPLWASDISPLQWFTTMGWAFCTGLIPAVP